MAGFHADITKWVQKAQGNASAVIRKIAFDLGARIIMRTPVDTGRARANWVYGIGAPVLTTVDLVDRKGSVNGSGAGQSAAKDALLEGLSTFDASSEQSIFIVNSVPYIGRLEYGSSKQAPTGMVRVTVAEFLGIVDEAVSLVRIGGGKSE